MYTFNPVVEIFFNTNREIIQNTLDEAVVVENFKNLKDLEKTLKYYQLFLDNHKELILYTLKSLNHILVEDKIIKVTLNFLAMLHLYESLEGPTRYINFTNINFDDWTVEKINNAHKLFCEDIVKQMFYKFSHNFDFKDMDSEKLTNIYWDKGYKLPRLINSLQAFNENKSSLEELENFQKLYGISPKIIGTEVKKTPTFAFTFWLFNYIFLDENYFFCSIQDNLTILGIKQFDRIMVDRELLDRIISSWYRGMIVQVFTKSDNFHIELKSKDNIKWIKDDLKKKYTTLFNSNKPNEIKLREFTELMLQEINDYSKAEFRISTKEKSIDSLYSIITESDKKKYHEVQQKLDTETYKNEKGRRVFTKKIQSKDLAKE